MFKKIFLLLLLILNFGQTALSVGELVEQGKFFDQKEVQVQGEVIGQPMYRGEQAWLNILTKDGNAIGVLVNRNLLLQLKNYGSYFVRGDEVLATGVFYRFAQKQSGETMIKASNLQFIRTGWRLKHKLSEQKLLVTIGLWLLICIISFKRIFRRAKYFLLARQRLRRN